MICAGLNQVLDSSLRTTRLDTIGQLGMFGCRDRSATCLEQLAGHDHDTASEHVSRIERAANTAELSHFRPVKFSLEGVSDTSPCSQRSAPRLRQCMARAS